MSICKVLKIKRVEISGKIASPAKETFKQFVLTFMSKNFKPPPPPSHKAAKKKVSLRGFLKSLRNIINRASDSLTALVTDDLTAKVSAPH